MIVMLVFVTLATVSPADTFAETEFSEAVEGHEKHHHVLSPTKSYVIKQKIETVIHHLNKHSQGWKKGNRKKALEKLNKKDERDREITAKSDEQSRKQEQKDVERSCKRRIRTALEYQRHHEVAIKKGKKTTKMWSHLKKEYDVVRLPTHKTDIGLVNKVLRQPGKNEDPCGCKLGVEGWSSENKYGPHGCKKGATTNRYEAQRCIMANKYCKQERRVDACGCRLGREGFSTKVHRCKHGSVTSAREAQTCLAWKSCPAEDKHHVRNKCSGWSPKTGKYKGQGGSCKPWGWTFKWCWVSKDYNGPGHKLMKKSSTYPCHQYAPCVD